MSRSEYIIRLPEIPAQTEQAESTGDAFPIEARIFGPYQSGFGAPRYYFAALSGSWLADPDGFVDWSFTGPATLMSVGDILAVRADSAGTLDVTALYEGVEYTASRAIIA